MAERIIVAVSINPISEKSHHVSERSQDFLVRKAIGDNYVQEKTSQGVRFIF